VFITLAGKREQRLDPLQAILPPRSSQMGIGGDPKISSVKGVESNLRGNGIGKGVVQWAPKAQHPIQFKLKLAGERERDKII